ncbi:MAG: FeoA family protein [Thermodesulfovibrionales bacterium]|nr:FeoA family protein [Thermodesulfovibrionales bacterium]
MEGRLIPLTMVTPGKEVILIGINGGRGVQSRLYSMGLVPGVKMRILNNNGAGPLMVAVRDTRLALGRGMAYKILVDNGRQ